MSKKKTTEQFINEARSVHGEEYIYDESIYEEKDKKLKIICKKHGEFWQTPANHIRGKQGCPKCKYEKLSINQRSNKEEFVKKANELHNGRYKYIGKYINNRTETTIVCPIHGEFLQTPHVHLSGHGCPKCANNIRYDTESFIAKATEVHNGKYLYTNTEYKNSHSKVKILCPIHGEFEQIAYYHLQGAGCPKCNESKLEKEVRSLFDENKVEYISQCDYKELPWLEKQRLDFYLPKYNIAIECQGVQHYIDKSNVFDSLQQNIERDTLKKQKCYDNGVRLLYYSEQEYEACHTLGNFYHNKNDLLNEILKYGT